MTLYNLRALPTKYLIAKYDEDLDWVKSYELTDNNECTCPAGVHGRYCRHKEMKTLFEEQGRINSSWFIDYDTRKWWYFDQDKCTLSEEPPKPKWRRL